MWLFTDDGVSISDQSGRYRPETFRICCFSGSLLGCVTRDNQVLQMADTYLTRNLQSSPNQRGHELNQYSPL